MGYRLVEMKVRLLIGNIGLSEKTEGRAEKKNSKI